MGARKSRKSGKRSAIKGKFLVSTEEIQKMVAEAEKQTREKKKGKGKRTNVPAEDTTDNECDHEIVESVESEYEVSEVEMLDCIVVQRK
jgi:hypothetical protein